MPDGGDSITQIRHLAGLVTASVLAGICWWLWEQAAWLAEFLGVPEFRILIALTGWFLVLSVAHFLTAPRT